MRRELYNRLVELIDRHRSWVEVVSADAVRTHAVIRDGRLRDVLCRTLVLRTSSGHSPYGRGMEWSIAHGDIFRAIRRLRSLDAGFDARMTDSPTLMTKTDAERIIFIATQGIVRLELTDIPIYTFSSL